MLGAVRVTPESLEALVVRIAKQYNVPQSLVKAVIKQESNWDVNASRYETHLNDTSWGLMQVLLKTAKDTLGNSDLTIQQLIDPTTNITAGTMYLGKLWTQWGNIKDAIAAYNAGSPRLDKNGKYVNAEYVDNVYRYFLMYDTLGPAASLIVTQSNPYIGIGLIGLVAVGGLILLSEGK
jgi:soluble lytic murein transglycosylase-like protein